MKSQRAYAEHILECIRRVLEDSAPGREAVFASRTLQDAILRNLQVLCESTQRIDELYRQRHPEIEFDEFLILRFKATNSPPYPFEWHNSNETRLDYAAVLSRISARYLQRF